jgi:hypothetical protein
MLEYVYKWLISMHSVDQSLNEIKFELFIFGFAPNNFSFVWIFVVIFLVVIFFHVYKEVEIKEIFF